MSMWWKKKKEDRPADATTPLPPLELHAEGEDLRALLMDGQSFLFGRIDERTFMGHYRKAMSVVRAQLPAPSGEQPALSREEYDRLCQEIALHSIYFYNVNRMRIRVTSSDARHPQALRIIQKHVDRRFGAGTRQALLAAARLARMTPDAFRVWAEADARFLER